MDEIQQADRQRHTDATVQPHYAPPGKSRRRAQRRLIAAALLFFALSAFVWGPGVWLRTSFLYYQWRVGAATPPAGTVVLDSRGGGSHPLPPLHAGFWRTWRRTHTTIPTDLTGAAVWSERMTTASGGRRTVTIYVADESTANGRALALRATTAALRPWYWIVAPHSDSRERTASRLGSSIWRFKIQPQEHLLIKAAQLDPKDPTQVLISYELDGKAGRIHAMLIEDPRWPDRANVKFGRNPTGPLQNRSAGGGSSD